MRDQSTRLSTMGRKNDVEEAGRGGTEVPTVLEVLYASRIGDSTHQGEDHHSGRRVRKRPSKRTCPAGSKPLLVFGWEVP